MLECVPNFSAGRDLDVIARIVDAAATFARIRDVHSDPDHNRSVLTMSGETDALIQAALAASLEAARLIDINRHEGVHPRLGAMDVVPFVTLGSTPLSEATVSADRLAKAFAEQAHVPCFIYGIIELPEVRRRAFIDLWPDYGPKAPHATAGATVVGAREVLVAFNVTLDSQDLVSARDIARKVRMGLPNVRALGFSLASKGLVQVSMNLTKPKLTGVGQAFDAVTEMTDQLGISVAYSEIVGLVPREALEGREPSSLLLGSAPKFL